jgi:predicted dehydrogenase
MTAVNLGLIGLGEWPREAYLPNLQMMPEANVVAVAARSEQTRAFAREYFGPDLTTHADYQDLLADHDVEAVIIAVPNPLHSQLIIAGAQSGKPIFFEPPIGLNEHEVASALAALEQTEAVIQIDHEIRYAPVMRELQRRLSDGVIGRPLMARARLWADWGFGGRDWNQDVAGEGFFLWLGCWYLDMLDCVFAEAPVRVGVVGGRAMNGALTDHGWAVLQYPGGGCGAVEFSLVNCADLEVSLHVLGTAGEMIADAWQGTLRWRTEAQSWRETSVPCHQPPHGFAGMYESLNAFINAAANGTPVLANLDVIRRVHEAALACSQIDMANRTGNTE